MEYFIVAFSESSREFMHRCISSTSKIEAINDFERDYEDCTVVNIIEL